MSGRRTVSAAASWWTTASLLIVAGGAYLYYTFGESPYARWSEFLLHSPAGLALWTALIANLVAVSARILHRRLMTPAVSPTEIRKMDVWGEFAQSGDGELNAVLSWMKKHGFDGDIREGGIAGRKAKFSFLPGALLRAGLVLMLTAGLFNVYLAKTEEAIMHAGDTHSFADSQITLSGIRTDIPEEFLLVGDEGAFTLGRVSSSVVSEGKKRKITSGFPAGIDGRYYRITGLGFSHEFSLESERHKTARRLDLNVLPPGKTDLVDLSPMDMVLTFTLHPEKTIRKGLLTGKDFLLGNPSYRVVVQRGNEKEKPEAVIVKAGGEETSTGLKISLGKKSLFVRVASVYDPALPAIYAGLLLFLAGLALMPVRFFWYEAELSVVPEGDALLIGYRQEYFRKWGIEKFLLMTEEIPPEAGPLSNLRIGQ